MCDSLSILAVHVGRVSHCGPRRVCWQRSRLGADPGDGTKCRKNVTGPVGYLLSVPSEGGDENLEGLRSDLANLGGGVSIVETTAQGWGEGRGAAPRSDWKPERLGASIPAGNVELWSRRGSTSCLSACGVPPSLADSWSGRNWLSVNPGGVFCMEVSPAGRQNH